MFVKFFFQVYLKTLPHHVVSFIHAAHEDRANLQLSFITRQIIFPPREQQSCCIVGSSTIQWFNEFSTYSLLFELIRAITFIVTRVACRLHLANDELEILARQASCQKTEGTASSTSAITIIAGVSTFYRILLHHNVTMNY